MRPLAPLETQTPSLLDKYLADHPGFPDRVKHLVGYDQLDPKKRTTEQLLAQAIHDEDTARYNYAALKFQKILKGDPNNADALLHLGESQSRWARPRRG